MSGFTDEQLAQAATFLEESIVESYGPPRKSQPQSNNASKCGHPCAFYLWAIRARWEELPGPDDGMPGLWKIGREAENSMKIALLTEGWNLVKTEVTFEDKELDIRGRMDWELSRPDHPVWKNPIPTEFKGVSGNYFGQINSFEDCFESSMTWVRNWPVQVLLYSYMDPEERPYVCLLLRNKINAKPRAIVVEAERYFHKLVEVNEVLAKVNVALREGSEPEPIQFDPSYCDRCDAAPICPTMRKWTSEGGLAEFSNPNLVNVTAAAWESGGETKKLTETAWEDLKRHAEQAGLYDGKVGDVKIGVTEEFRVEVKHHKTSRRMKVVRIAAEEEDVDDS